MCALSLMISYMTYVVAVLTHVATYDNLTVLVKTNKQTSKQTFLDCQLVKTHVKVLWVLVIKELSLHT